MGRADRFVEAQPQYAPLAARLLGRTWIVEKLEHALQLAGDHGHAVHFVTLAGELRQTDGTLVVGPRQGASGLISRRSQLRELNEQLADLDGRIVAAETAADEMQARIREQQEAVGHHAAAHRQAEEVLADHRMKLTTAEERRAQFNQQRAALDGEHRAASVQHDAAVGRLADAREKRRQHEAGLTEMEARLAGFQQHIARLEGERQARNRETTETKVELAKSEERLRNLRLRLRQFEENRQERGRAIDEGRQQLELCIQRAEASRWNILRAESELADLYLRKEAVAAETVRYRTGGRPSSSSATSGASRSNGAGAGPQDRGAIPRQGPGGQRGPPGARGPCRPASRRLPYRTGRARTPAQRRGAAAARKKYSRKSKSCGERSMPWGT